MTVTYRIAEEAVWNDGEPITSSDFRYTWEQIANGSDIYDKTGYQDIESVDDSDPRWQS
jgi:ABC-type transport system substrate-binding protein